MKTMTVNFSRRDFLKASGAGLLGLVLAELRLDHALAQQIPKQGRATISGVELLGEPFYRAKKIQLLGQDQIVDITGEIDGDKGYGNPFNSKWYQVDSGYVYSGWLQPVETLYQKPNFTIPNAGILGEITVPYSEARLAASVFADRGYRIYYSTTHWVTDTVVNQNEKSIWYKIYDRLTQKSFYVSTHDMRLIPAEEIAPLSAAVKEESKSIFVDLKAQLVTAFEGDKPVLVARCSTGDQGTETPTGEFQTFHKGSSVHMTNQGDGTANTYHLPGVPWVSFFTGTGVAFHGTYWHNNYGRPSSRGCVNLTPDTAKFIYRWTRPQVPPETPYLYQPGDGTRVHVTSLN